MGIADFFSDVVASWSFPQEVYAEAPAEDDEEESKDDDEEKSEEKDGDDEEKGGDDEEDDEEEEEEEEEEEPEDPKPLLEEECSRSSQCIGYKHHYDECVERVTSQSDDENYKGPKEDCVEEFFHLQHCAAQCAAPKLFKMLK